MGGAGLSTLPIPEGKFLPVPSIQGLQGSWLSTELYHGQDISSQLPGESRDKARPYRMATGWKWKEDPKGEWAGLISQHLGG